MKETELNILLVEDEPAIRVFLKISLMKSDLPIGHVFEAENGKEALEILKSVQTNFILTDINMPVMDGVEFLTRMHSDPVNKDIPVVAVSSVKTDTVKNMLRFWGHGYLEKPFMIGELKEQIQKQHSKSNEYYLYG